MYILMHQYTTQSDLTDLLHDRNLRYASENANDQLKGESNVAGCLGYHGHSEELRMKRSCRLYFSLTIDFPQKDAEGFYLIERPKRCCIRLGHKDSA
jgi:hypothetical protein